MSKEVRLLAEHQEAFYQEHCRLFSFLIVRTPMVDTSNMCMGFRYPTAIYQVYRPL